MGDEGRRWQTDWNLKDEKVTVMYKSWGKFQADYAEVLW